MAPYKLFIIIILGIFVMAQNKKGYVLKLHKLR